MHIISLFTPDHKTNCMIIFVGQYSVYKLILTYKQLILIIVHVHSLNLFIVEQKTKQKQLHIINYLRKVLSSVKSSFRNNK